MDKLDWVKKIEAAANKFWQEEYPAKDFEQKCAYWQKIMEKGMEEQKKGGQPIFENFNAAWYNSVKEQDSEIDTILNKLFETVWNNHEKAVFWSATTEIDDDENS